MNRIPKTMKALVAFSGTDYRFVPDYPMPVCGPDDIVLKTEGCGVCAGDTKCHHGAAMFWGDGIQPSWVQPPFIQGHEFVGLVAQLGENVRGFELGERLVADQIVPCGECRFCKDGHYWMCQPHEIFGFFGKLSGGMAEYIRLPKKAVVHKVPSNQVHFGPLWSCLQDHKIVSRILA